jgi:hypothetical protein
MSFWPLCWSAQISGPGRHGRRQDRPLGRRPRRARWRGWVGREREIGAPCRDTGRPRASQIDAFATDLVHQRSTLLVGTGAVRHSVNETPGLIAQANLCARVRERLRRVSYVAKSRICCRVGPPGEPLGPGFGSNRRSGQQDQRTKAVMTTAPGGRPPHRSSNPHREGGFSSRRAVSG